MPKKHIKPKKIYPRNTKAFNEAQVHEKEQFLKLLYELCQYAPEKEQTNGRPRIPINDVIFSCCYKIYSTVSARRFMSDLRDAHAKGYISRVAHFNTLYNYIENEALTPILKDLIIGSSLPFSAIEKDFAVDSTGFTSSQYLPWVSSKYGAKLRQSWVKVHVICGVKTNIITAVEIMDPHTHDTVPFPDLVDKTAENFTLREISADKAYASLYNYNAVEAHGATPFIAFKTTHKASSPGLWNKMYYFFHLKQEEFMEHYHKRSNVESTFSMIKAKFGGYVRGRTKTAQINECLCKIICHNICVIIQALYEY